MQTWHILTIEYLTALAAAKRSSGTIRLHRHYLGVFAAAIPSPITATTLQLQHVLARPSWTSAETVKSARTVARKFFRWLHATGRRDDDPAAGLEPVRVPTPLPRPAPEIVAHTAAADPDERIAFMAMLAAFAALRAGEIAVVHQNDWDGRELLVHGKGGKERLLPIEHYGLVAHLGRVRGWAFPGRTNGHLSSGHVTRLLSDALPGVWTAHTLRHRWATQAYSRTGDIRAISKLLGHAKIDTTLRYTAVPDDRARSVMRAVAA